MMRKFYETPTSNCLVCLQFSMTFSQCEDHDLPFYPQMHKRDHTALRCIAQTITKIRKQAVPDARWSMSLLTMAARIIERCYTFVVREMSPIMLGE